MQIKHSQLEEVRVDPYAYSGQAGGAPGFGPSKIRALHQAAFRYHRPGQTLPAAEHYLQQAFSTRFKTAARLDKFIEYLAEYDRTFQSSGNVVIKVMLRLQRPLSPSVTLLGEVPRLDIAAGGGYAAWLFSEYPRAWQDELRMPLIQAYLSRLMGVSLDRVTVGFYFFATAAYESCSYDPETVAQAIGEVEQIAAIADQN